MDNEQQDRFFDSILAVSGHLVAGLDLTDLMSRLMATCTSLLPVTAAGILVEDQEGALAVLASSSDEGRVLEVLELLNQEGPCVDAFRSGSEVTVPRLVEATDRWPRFTEGALARGVVSCCALPLELDGKVFGALNLFRDAEGGLSRRSLQIGRLLARLATVGIINHAVSREHAVLAEQLSQALESRVHIEQAKGVIAARAGLSMAAAFDLLRATARSSQRPLVDVAIDITEGRLPVTRAASQAKPRG